MINARGQTIRKSSRGTMKIFTALGMIGLAN